MSQRIGHQCVNYVALYVHFQRHIFKSDGCHRELRTRVGKTLCAEVLLKMRFLKVMNVTENSEFELGKHCPRKLF